MNKRITVFVFVLALLAVFGISNVLAQSETPTVLVMSVDGVISPSLAEYLERGLRTAHEKNAEVVILKLNTPGGGTDVMTRMVEAIRASEVPVVVYVTPRGAVAGSAGTVITIAGHLSAMTPETAIGAASPISSEGQDLQETLETKIKEIIKAQIRSLAEGRIPPEAIAAAEDTVENASALSANEAYEVGLVNFLADDLGDLLRQLDGQIAVTAAGEVTIDTKFAQVQEFSLSFIEEVLTFLTNPNIVFLLLTIGVQSVLIEISSPGGWVAGFIGVVSLALAGYGLGILPVNWFGLVFMLTAFVLFVLELKAASHGALAVAGVGSFIAGALILFNSSNTPSFYRVSVPLVVVVGVATAGIFLLAVTFAIRALRSPARMGRDSLVGRVGRARTDISAKKTGEVQLASELWSAQLESGSPDVSTGDEVEVVAVEGLRLRVRKRG